MENKINIADLLRSCPQGMELDCTMYDRVTFDEVITVIGFDDKKRVKIILSTHYSDGTKDEINLTEYGTYTYDETAKCVIFPKGKTTWEGFHRPWTIQDAKDGDVISYGDGWTCIFKCIHGICYSSYCFITSDGEFHTCYEKHEVSTTINGKVHLATKEQCNFLFQKIKEAGYKWNPETKTLEKLPKFKVGDRVKHISAYASGIVVEVTDKGYHIEYPKAKGFCYISFELEKDYELVPNKFDINTLVPFESRVLVREDKKDVWRPTFYGFFHQHSKRFYTTSCGTWLMCIPYNENTKHLTGTTNDCDNFYKTWEK